MVVTIQSHLKNNNVGTREKLREVDKLLTNKQSALTDPSTKYRWAYNKNEYCSYVRKIMNEYSMFNTKKYLFFFFKKITLIQKKKVWKNTRACEEKKKEKKDVHQREFEPSKIMPME